MDIITRDNYSTYYLGAGDILYSPTNHTHYILTHVSGSSISMRPMLYGLGHYGAEVSTTREGLIGFLVIQGGAG